MNVDNINRVIEAIRTEKEIQFSMPDWFKPQVEGCKTVCCIGGTCAVVGKFKTVADTYNAPFHYIPITAKWLGITEDDAHELCCAEELEDDCSLEDITKDTAIACLEHLRDTGNVDWLLAARKTGLIAADHE